MKIGIDARFWGQAGPGRYVKNLVLALEKIDSEGEYVIFLNFEGGLKKSQTLYGVKSLTLGNRGKGGDKGRSGNFRFVEVGVPWYSLAEQIKLPSVFAREKLDLLHVPHFNIPIFYFGKIAITIHDLTIHRFSTAQATTRWIPIYRLKRLVYRFIFWLALKRAEVIFVPTEFVKKDLLGEYAWLDSRKIVVTPEGVGIQNPKSQILNPKQIPSPNDQNSRPYLLYVGSMYPHKNLSRLVAAFGLVAGEVDNISLVLVGKKDFFQERLRSEVLNTEYQIPDTTRIIFPAFRDPNGYVPDEDLAMIYKNALAFVFPSLSEGFGLPPLEAMSFGIPVAASNATCIPEVCGDAALYFDPEDPEDMARKIRLLINNPALRKDLVQKGFENLKRFSWDKMAEETLAGYSKRAKTPPVRAGMKRQNRAPKAHRAEQKPRASARGFYKSC